MSRIRQLERRDITYSSAKEKEFNVLHELGYKEQRHQFFRSIEKQGHWIQTVVKHHLNLDSSEDCDISDQSDWLFGSFNVCIPLTVKAWKGGPSSTRLLLRLPLPHRVGEEFRPGNADEKIRCEAGAYVWFQENCPDIPIPQLYGFALSTGEMFTRLQDLPYFRQCLQLLRRRLLSFFGFQVPSQYVRHELGTWAYESLEVRTGYLLIEYVERGEMLSNTWLQRNHEADCRQNLFRGLSRLLLNIARVPVSRIGSFTIDNQGYLQLSNRPLSVDVQALENEKIPTDIPRDFTYETVESYVADLLSVHDNRLRYQPNAINDSGDAVYQMSALAAMRTIAPLFFQPEFRRGPFLFTLTDLHQSNIFVDQDWNITCLVDLEWACSQPVEMVQPPYWLTNQSVDTIIPEDYDKIRKEFMAILQNESRDMSTENSGLNLPSIMQRTWETGMFWYALALQSPTGLFTIFYDHVKPRLKNEHLDDQAFCQIMPPLWGKDLVRFLARKLSDKEAYDTELQKAFEAT